MKLKFALSANGYECLYNGKDHFKSYFITDDFEKEIDMKNVFIYLSASDPNGTWCAMAEAHDGDFGKTSVYFGPASNPKQFKADIPSDYCYNRKNYVINYEKQPHYFLFLERGRYKYVGKNYNYNGFVEHNPKIKNIK